MRGDAPKLLTIKSDISELTKVQSLVNEIFMYHNIDKKYFNKVFLCFSEAVANAIIHGNKYNNEKEIIIQVDCDKKSLNVKISDEGDGFDINNIPDPTLSINLKREAGRGIFIIKSLSQFTGFNKKGNSIHFKLEVNE